MFIIWRSYNNLNKHLSSIYYFNIFLNKLELYTKTGFLQKQGCFMVFQIKPKCNYPACTAKLRISRLHDITIVFTKLKLANCYLAKKTGSLNYP